MTNLELKKDESGNAVLENGHPVYVFPDGTEKPLDVPTLYTNLGKANTEAKDRRLELTELKEKMKIFDGIDDISAYKEQAEKALETVKNLEDKELVDAKKVEELKAQVSSSWEKKLNDTKNSLEEKLKEREGLVTKKDQQIRDLMIRGAFDRSEFLREKTTLSPDIAYDAFGKFFKIEESKGGDLRINAFDTEGNQMFSEERPGAEPDMEEAISILINRHPQKDRFLMAESTGAGTKTDAGGGGKASKMKLDEWLDKISRSSEEERNELIRKKNSQEIIVDTG